ncbi:hypothetical protein [Demequina phytophila]|uniref:hypothetical protein n=1 Tax=Demequina phytophila TaxID=1638981 RepID=UPI00078099C5|nr:hypothetical protein [Demequina phytophila]
MRGWAWAGAVAVAAVVAALAVPWVPAASATTVPVEREWTLTDEESGHCVDVGFSTTLEGTERRPVIAALPWRVWTDTSLVGDTVASVHAGTGCEGTGELSALDAGIVVGDATCGQWDFGPPSMGDTLGETTFGCDNSSIRLDVGNLDPAEGMEMHQEIYPWWGIGRDGCIDVIAWADINWTLGEGGHASGVGLPGAETFCLSDAG